MMGYIFFTFVSTFQMLEISFFVVVNGSNQSNSRHATHRNPNPCTSSSHTQPTTSIRTHEEIDYHCIHIILGAISERLYNIYYTIKSAKELQDILKSKYGHDDTRVKKFTTSDFNKFRMVDSKPMNDQIHKFETLIHQISTNRTKLDESFQVACLIDKLPNSWSDYAKTLSCT